MLNSEIFNVFFCLLSFLVIFNVFFLPFVFSCEALNIHSVCNSSVRQGISNNNTVTGIKVNCFIPFNLKILCFKYEIFYINIKTHLVQ